jgi:hypothetical protein
MIGKPRLHLIVRDRKGRIHSDEHVDPKSPTYNWGRCMQYMIENGPVTARDTTDTDRASQTPNLNGAIAGVIRGIVLGTGATAATRSDYVMETLIAHGSGTGQLEYGATTYYTDYYGSAAEPPLFKFVRTFVNNSGAEITVKEFGLYAYDSPYSFLMDRSVVNVAVPNGSTLTVEYEFSL